MKNNKFLLTVLLSLGLIVTACNTSNGNKTQSNESEPTSISESSSSDSSSETSESVHQHTYSAMYYEVQPDFFHDGNIAYYECTECHKKFDEHFNEVESVVLPKLSSDLVLLVNNENKGDFTVTEQDDSHIVWDLKGKSLHKDDVIGVAAKADNSKTYSYFPNTKSNITDEFKIHNDVSSGDVNIVGTPNGLHLSVSGFEYDGIVIKINDTEYPMNKVSYLKDSKETYIYGYVYINVNDVVTVIDKDNNIVYDYDDFEDDTLWNTYDFHRGSNGEIVFDYQTRYGFEFDRGGDKKVSITKAFAPNDTSSVAVHFSSGAADGAMNDMVISKTDPEYENTLWYIKHEAVINNSDIVDYIETNGLHIFNSTFTLDVNEKFNIKDLTNNSVITADHLADLHCSAPTGYFAIEGDYIKTLKAGYYSVIYMPSCSVISIFESTIPAAADAYIMVKGDFKPLTKDSDNVVTYENLVAAKNDYVAFTDASYGLLTVTFASSVDNTVCHKMDTSGMSLIYFDKAGTFTLHLNLTTLEFSLDIIEIDDTVQPMTGGSIYFSKNGGNKSLSVNPENADELCLKNMEITDITGYAVVYDQDVNMIYPSLASGSEQYASIQGGVLIYITQTGTFDFYINKTTFVLRIEKQ